MTFVGEITSALLELRTLANSLMVDTCTIRRVTGVTTDPLTGEDSPTLAVVYPDPSWPADHPWKHGPCKVQGLDPQESTPDAGGHTFTIQRYRVDIPVGAYRPMVGDLPTIETATLDPYLAGIEYRVVGLLHKSMATAYRLAATDEVA